MIYLIILLFLLIPCLAIIPFLDSIQDKRCNDYIKRRREEGASEEEIKMEMLDPDFIL